jgi:antitoxin component of MazEF toxin-antitoxin module
MKRKVVQTGGSLAVTLPQEVAEEFGLKKGDEVDVSVHPMTGAITIRPGVRYFDEGQASKRFKESVRDLLSRRAALFRKLA